MGKLIGSLTGTTSAAKKADARYREAADKAVFDPWSVSGSYFGDASFDKVNKTGSYNLSPELMKLRDMFMGESFNLGEGAGAARADADAMKSYGRGLFDDASGRDIAGTAGNYYNDIQSIMEPQRAKDQQSLANNLYSSGRSGLGISDSAGGYLNPERTEYLTGVNRQNQQLAYDSLDRARGEQRGDINFGLGLYGMSDQIRSNPFTQANNMFGLGAGIENMGMQPFNQGIALGSAATPGQQMQQQGYNAGTAGRFGADQANSAMFTNLLASGAGAYTGGFSNPFASAGGYGMPGTGTPAYGSTDFWRGSR